jgi:hypothetical protein
VAALPHWARVAFAARCARRVYPFFTKNWPDAVPKRVQSVERAIELAEKSAAAAKSQDGLKSAVVEAAVTVGAALQSLYGIVLEDRDPLPPDGNAGKAASFAAKVAQRAAEAAHAPPEKSTEYAAEALRWVMSLCPTPLVEDLHFELGALQGFAEIRGWDDDTPVPRAIFDEMIEPKPSRFAAKAWIGFTAVLMIAGGLLYFRTMPPGPPILRVVYGAIGVFAISAGIATWFRPRWFPRLIVGLGVAILALAVVDTLVEGWAVNRLFGIGGGLILLTCRDTLNAELAVFDDESA